MLRHNNSDNQWDTMSSSLMASHSWRRTSTNSDDNQWDDTRRDDSHMCAAKSPLRQKEHRFADDSCWQERTKIAHFDDTRRDDSYMCAATSPSRRKTIRSDDDQWRRTKIRSTDSRWQGCNMTTCFDDDRKNLTLGAHEDRAWRDTTLPSRGETTVNESAAFATRSTTTSPPRQDSCADTALQKAVCTNSAGPTKLLQFNYRSRTIAGDFHSHALFLRQFIIKLFGDKVAEQKLGLTIDLAVQFSSKPTGIDRAEKATQQKIKIDMSKIVVYKSTFAIQIRELKCLAIRCGWNKIPPEFYLILASIGNHMRTLTASHKNIILLALKRMTLYGLLPPRPCFALIDVIRGALKKTDLTEEDWTKIETWVKSLTKNELMP